MSEERKSSFTCLLAHHLPAPWGTLTLLVVPSSSILGSSLRFSRLWLLLLKIKEEKGEEEEREGRREARDFLIPLFLLRLLTYIAASLPKVAKLPGKRSLCFFNHDLAPASVPLGLLELLRLKSAVTSGYQIQWISFNLLSQSL